MGGDTVDVAVSTTPVADAAIVRGHFASVSAETSGAPALTAHSSYAALLGQLRAPGGDGIGPRLRVGGNSADLSCYECVPEGAPNPPGVEHVQRAAELQQFMAWAEATNGTIVMDATLSPLTSTAWAAGLAVGVQEHMNWERVVGFEIGNEPDLFGGLYRSSSWSYAQYDANFSAAAANVTAHVPALRGKIQGAVYCCKKTDFDDHIPDYVKAHTADGLLGSLSYHRYPVSHCNKARPPPSMWQLLSDASSAEQAAFLAPFSAAARAASIPFWIGEGNSCACGGAYNLSDVLGAALWAADFMFEVAAVGTHGMNFHGGTSGAYAPVAYPDPSSDTPDVRPLFYAMWAFSRATAAPDGATLLQTTVNSTNSLIKAHAVAAGSGTTRVTMIHKDPNATVSAAVSVAVAAGTGQRGAVTAQLLRLDVPSASTGLERVFARTGLSFAGQTFDGSTDGKPIGTVTPEAVSCSGSGVCSFTLEPAQLAVLVVRSS